MVVFVSPNISAEEITENKTCFSLSDEDYQASIKIIEKLNLKALNYVMEGRKKTTSMTSAIKAGEQFLDQKGCTVKDETRLEILRTKYKKIFKHWISEEFE
jgi:hypothetical protein